MSWSLDEAEAVDGGYGGVVAVNVIHMVDDPGAAVERMIELAGPGGVVVVGTPTTDVSVAGVYRAMKRHGVGLVRRVGFVAVHLILGPLRALAGAGITHDRSEIIWSVEPEHRKVVGGVTEVLSWRNS